MKILVCPDKFKGSLTAKQVCDIIEEELADQHEITKLPLADGGEGTSSILGHYFGGKRVEVRVNNPIGHKIYADYYYAGDKQEAYIEMAAASGLELLEHSDRNPLETSSYGTGQLIQHALHAGAKKIYLCIGGSATNEGGIGMAAALGWRFLDASGKAINPIGKELIKINSIAKPDSLNPAEVIVLSDVENLLTGPQGATYVYGPQKGADEKALKLLERGLQNLSHVVEEQLNVNLNSIRGGGAAGGLGAGAVAFLNAQIVSGADEVIDLLQVREHVAKCDIILTGEGKFDHQTLHGKLVNKICSLGQKFNKPLLVVCGKSTLTEKEWKSVGISNVIALNEGYSDEQSMRNAAPILREKINVYFKK